MGGTSADGIASPASASALGREMRHRAGGKEDRRPAQTDGAEKRSKVQRGESPVMEEEVEEEK